MSQGPPLDLLADLTAAQQEAVTHVEGPLLILAGAGSGKTRVITRRVACLLQQGVRPANILAITFTNKAAGEMRQRVEQLVPGNRVWISTFHSLGARLLRQYADRLGLDRNFTIYDIDDRNKLVKDALEAAGIDNVKFTPERIGGAISKAKNQLLTPEQYAATGERLLHPDRRAGLPRSTRSGCATPNALDFDDLLYLPALALRHERGAARRTGRPLPLRADRRVPGHELGPVRDRPAAVGRPPEPVRGRRPGPDRFTSGAARTSGTSSTSSATSPTPASSRSTRTTAARRRSSTPPAPLIAHNKQRKTKTLVTDNPQGEPVRVLTFDTGLDEAEGVVARIKDAVEGRASSRYRDFAIFLRINALTRSLESAFVKHGVPFQIVKGLAFFERKENRDVLAYLRLLVNPQDTCRSCASSTSRPAASARCRSTTCRRYAADRRDQPARGAPGRSRRSPRSRARPRRACATSTG